MKRMHGVVLLLLLLNLTAPAHAAEKEAGVSASGAITEAPAASAAGGAASIAPASTEASPSSSAPASALDSSTTAPSTTATSITAPPTTAPPASAAINWKAGPAEMPLLDQGVVKVPQGYAFLTQDDARTLLLKLGNPNTSDVIGLLSGSGGSWLIAVRFDQSGFVRDRDVPDWKLDELLDTLRKAMEQTNAIRKKDGLGETAIVDWLEKPDYDAQTRRLIWAVSTKEKGAKETDFQAVNFNTYVLGRDGYVNFNLVTDLSQLEQNKKHASTLVSAFTYNEGKRYSDFKKADKVAPYNVTGLVARSDVPVAEGKKEAAREPAPTGSKLTKFLKVFGVILLSLLGLVGMAGGVFMLIRKKRNAKMAAEVAALEAAPAKPK